MGKRVDPRRVKSHWTHTPDEWASKLGVHKNTVLRWIRDDGLEAIMDQRPYLIRGVDLKTFLMEKRKQKRFNCGRGELPCFSCHKPREPAGGMLEYATTNRTSGMLSALCCECLAEMRQAVKEDHIAIKFPKCQVTVTQPQSTLSGSTDHLVNVHLEGQCEASQKTSPITSNPPKQRNFHTGKEKEE